MPTRAHFTLNLSLPAALSLIDKVDVSMQQYLHDDVVGKFSPIYPHDWVVVGLPEDFEHTPGKVVRSDEFQVRRVDRVWYEEEKTDVRFTLRALSSSDTEDEHVWDATTCSRLARTERGIGHFTFSIEGRRNP